MVRARSVNSWRVMPSTNTMGRNTHTVVRVEEVTAAATLANPPLTIAAASIIAKVTRDRQMEELDRLYPGYNFMQHKGYGTAQHIAALKELGPCPAHRRSFIKNFL